MGRLRLASRDDRLVDRSGEGVRATVCRGVHAHRSRSGALVGCLLAVSTLMIPNSARSQGRGPTGPTTEPPIHDPTMIESDGTYYLFGTGRGIQVWSSPDLETWTHLAPVFETAPDWIGTMLPGFRNDEWAPDISFHDGTYYLYYAVSAFGRNNSAIGVATNETLDPKDPSFKWVDHGMVVRSVPGRDMWNAIDAQLFFDEGGTPWLTFGSFWQGIKLVQLAPDLMRPADPPVWHTVAARNRYWKLDERDAGDAANPELPYDSLYPQRIVEMEQNMQDGAIEAPFIFKKGDWYYLFVSWDRCCRGVNSTYKVVVGRSKRVEGPYRDREGQEMVHGGGSLVVYGFGDGGRWAAGGHEAAYTFGGTDYLVFHAYDATDQGRSKLLVKPIEWDAQGWPRVSLER